MSWGGIFYLRKVLKEMQNYEAYQFIKLYLKPSCTSLDPFTERLSQKSAALKVSNCLHPP